MKERERIEKKNIIVMLNNGSILASIKWKQPLYDDEKEK